MEFLNWSNRTKFQNKNIIPLIETGTLIYYLCDGFTEMSYRIDTLTKVDVLILSKNTGFTECLLFGSCL